MSGLRLARVLAAVAIVCATSGCSDYLSRRDTILLGAGDAVQTNIATHIIDPWPAASRNTGTDTSGQRAQNAIERYRNPQAGPLTGGSGAPNQAPPAINATGILR